MLTRARNGSVRGPVNACKVACEPTDDPMSKKVAFASFVRSQYWRHLVKMHPLNVRFVVLPAKWRLEELDMFRTTALPSGLLKIFLLPKHLTELTRHSNDSSTVASHKLAYMEPKLSNVVVLERRFALLRHRRTRNWATTTSSACVLNNGSRVAGATCLCGDSFKFRATRKLNSASSGIFHQNPEFKEAWL